MRRVFGSSSIGGATAVFFFLEALLELEEEEEEEGMDGKVKGGLKLNSGVLKMQYLRNYLDARSNLK